VTSTSGGNGELAALLARAKKRDSKILLGDASDVMIQLKEI
jgi:ubiquinone/menaquinone biosynthesis C-methylase UbiE